MFEDGKLISIDKVKEEIIRNDDELKKWIEGNLSDQFFKSTDAQDVLSEYTKVINWATSKSKHYVPNAINEFLKFNNADSWLIAYALVINEGCKIITYEKSEPNRK